MARAAASTVKVKLRCDQPLDPLKPTKHTPAGTVLGELKLTGVCDAGTIFRLSQQGHLEIESATSGAKSGSSSVAARGKGSAAAK